MHEKSMHVWKRRAVLDSILSIMHCAHAQGVVQELRGMACICGDAIAEGLRGLEPGEPDTKRGFRAAQRCIDLVHELSHRCACALAASWAAANARLLSCM